MKKLLQPLATRIETQLPTICKQAAKVTYVADIGNATQPLYLLKPGHQPQPWQVVQLAYIQN